MRRLFCAPALALLLALASPPAEGKTLEEILRDKGVITEADYREAVKENALADYRPGRGITVTSRDGHHQAQLGGRLQVRYTFTGRDEGEDESSLRIRRMELWLKGHAFSPRLLYAFQGSFADDFELEDAYAGYRFADPFTFFVGQIKPPQARQELTSSGSQLFVDRSLANDTFNLGRDIGVLAAGELAGGRLAYMAGVFNGNGPNTGNQETEHMFAARLDLNPFGPFKLEEPARLEKEPEKKFREELRLNLGASVATQTMVAADAGRVDADNDVLDRALNLDALDAAAFTAAFGDELDWTLWTANLHAMVAGLTFGGEYYRLRADPQAGGAWDADGYYLQVGWQVIPATFELAVRHSAIESTDATAPTFARFDVSQLQFGLNWYFRQHHAKLQSDYTLVDDDQNAGQDNRIFRLQAQVTF